MKLPNLVRRMLFRQQYRAHIRREQAEFLREHPELRLPTDPEPERTENDS